MNSTLVIWTGGDNAAAVGVTPSTLTDATVIVVRGGINILLGTRFNAIVGMTIMVNGMLRRDCA